MLSAHMAAAMVRSLLRLPPNFLTFSYFSPSEDITWHGVGSSSDADDSEREEEYEGEEQLATVTVVEDFDPATLIYGPTPTPHSGAPDKDTAKGKAKRIDEKPAKAKLAPAKAAKAKKASTRAKEVKYQTSAARRADKRKQLARHTEKAERAGGKQQRKRPKGRR
jgi:ribosomal RNA-processing protein 17